MLKRLLGRSISSRESSGAAPTLHEFKRLRICQTDYISKTVRDKQKNLLVICRSVVLFADVHVNVKNQLVLIVRERIFML